MNGNGTIRPLDGLRVVELGQFIQAAYCTRLLADLGAEVVKVEPPEGDPARRYGPFRSDDPGALSGLHAYLDSGKKSAVADLGTDEGLRRVRALAASADIFVTNLSVTRRRQIGLTSEVLREDSPGLISVALSVFGETGPWSELPAEDIQAQAMSGIAWTIGEPNRPPLIIPYFQGDFQAGAHGAAAALAALLGSTEGRGASIDIASADVLAAAAGTNALIYLYYGRQRWERAGNRAYASGGPYPYVILPCKDGSVCLIGRTQLEWQRLTEAMGKPDWTREERYNDLNAMGQNYPEEVDRLIIPWLANHTRAELSRMAAEGGFALGPLKRMSEVVADPQFRAREFFRPMEGEANAELPSRPYMFSGFDLNTAALPPALGQHTAEVFGAPAERTEAAR